MVYTLRKPIKKLSKESLYELYINRGMSIQKMAKSLKSAKITILKYLKLYGLHTRDRLKMTSGKNHWKYNKDLLEICSACNVKYRKRTKGKSSFCSFKCYWKSMEKAVDPDHKRFLTRRSWKEVANLVRNLNGNICKNCKISNAKCKSLYKKSLHVHHIIPRDKNLKLAFELNNLVLLCSVCHPKEHKQERCFRRNKRGILGETKNVRH